MSERPWSPHRDDDLVQELVEDVERDGPGPARPGAMRMTPGTPDTRSRTDERQEDR
jgi:hypothetical protein